MIWLSKRDKEEINWRTSKWCSASLEKHQLKMDPPKCVAEVVPGKFLGFLSDKGEVR